MNIKSVSVPLAKKIESEIKNNPVGVVVIEAYIYKAIEAAQQKMHQTAFGVGILCLFIGYVAGWLIFAFNFCG